jgi:hypothetical protein
MIRNVLCLFAGLLVVLFLAPSAVWAEGGEALGTSSEGGISGAIYGKHGGFAHGFLSVAERYADNILYTPEEEMDDFITTVSPGVWFSIPGGQEEISGTATASSAPGGVVKSSLTSPSYRRLLAYLAYTPEFTLYREHSDENTESHQLEASLEYRFRGDLTLGFLDRFDASHDDRQTDNTLLINAYRNNLFQVFATYDVSSDLTFDLICSHFLVDYTEDRNLYRDRRDMSVGGTLSYHLTSKTSLFAEYERVDMEYDNAGLRSSREQNFQGGLRWEITEKSAGVVKAGWGIRDWDLSQAGDEGSFRMDIQVDHRFTNTTRIAIGAYQRTEETNTLAADYRIGRGASFRYTQKIRSKLQAHLGGSWLFETYKGGAGELKEETYACNTGLTYTLRKWLSAGLEYTFSRQTSDFELYDYTANEVVFRVAGSI